MQRKLTKHRDNIEVQAVNITHASEHETVNTEEATHPEIVNTKEASQPQASNISQSSAPQTLNDVGDMFDDLPDSVFASLPDFQTIQIANNEPEVNNEKHAVMSDTNLNGPRMLNGRRMFNVPRPSNGPRMLNVPKVKKRSSARLRKLKTKNIQGPGASADEPFEIEDETGFVVMPTQESAVER